MVGSLANREADVAVAGLSLNFERFQVIDFSSIIHQSDYGLLVKNPGNVRPNVWAFLVAFTVQVWCLIVFVVLLLALNYFVHKKLQRINIEVIQAGSENMGICHSIALVLLAMMQLTYPIQVSDTSLRALHLSIWLFSYLIFVFYTGDLTSRLTVLPGTVSFSSLEEAVHEGYILTLTKGAVQHVIFSSSVAGIKHKIWKDMIEPNPNLLVESTEVALELVISEDKYAKLVHNFHPDPR